MSPLTPYLALASFPIAVCLGLNPVRFSWSFHHGSEQMPTEVRENAEAADRYIYFIIDGLTIAFVAILMTRHHVALASAGVHAHAWKRNFLWGIAAGLLFVIWQLLMQRWFTGKELVKTTDRFLRRSRLFWALVFVAGALSEEFWAAFCLYAMAARGHSAAVSVIATASVFGAVHLHYGVSAATAVALKGAISALFFLWSGSLIPMVVFHFVGNLGSLYFIRTGAATRPTA